MDPKFSALERAFVIAKSGRAASVAEIVEALKREGYLTWSLDGPHLRKQLRALIKAAREKGPQPS